MIVGAYTRSIIRISRAMLAVTLRACLGPGGQG